MSEREREGGERGCPFRKLNGYISHVMLIKADDCFYAVLHTLLTGKTGKAIVFSIQVEFCYLFIVYLVRRFSGQLKVLIGSFRPPLSPNSNGERSHQDRSQASQRSQCLVSAFITK